MNSTTTINTKKFFSKAVNTVTIDENRKNLLSDIAGDILIEKEKLNKVKLNFICTHNSRRSHLTQIWAHYAIHYFRLKRIKSYSGGTEVTAIHENTVKTLQDVGFEFNLLKFSHENPVYEVSFKTFKKPIVSFSKLYDDPINRKPFIAITTCDAADKNCPFIPDALKRRHLPYIDPKFSDNTIETSEVYLETSRTIAAEMHFLFHRVKNLL